ncbi:MAG: class I SAM-dependent methyltransferase [Chloroflexota bacterium]|jgi:SAM-dependent methyltransferase
MLSLERQNQLRERYQAEHPGWRPATEVYAEFVRDYLQPGSMVLDLGCGRGGLVEQLGHPLNQVVGLDPDWLSLKEHRLASQHPPFPRTAGLSRYLPFAGSSFDLVFASWLLEHLDQPEADFREIGRVLQPGGVFIFITPNRRHPLSGLNLILSRFGSLQDRIVPRFYGRSPADAFPAFYRANTRADLGRLARQSKMRLVELQAIPDPTYLSFKSSFYRLSCWLEGLLPADRSIHLVGIARKE